MKGSFPAASSRRRKSSCSSLDDNLPPYISKGGIHRTSLADVNEGQSTPLPESSSLQSPNKKTGGGEKHREAANKNNNSIRSFWTLSDGWEHRPRPSTSSSYRKLGHKTIAATGGSNQIDPLHHYHPGSSFCSLTARGASHPSSFLYWSNGSDISPCATTYHLPPSFAPKPPRYITQNRYFGLSRRFLSGQSFIPVAQGADALFNPSESQVGYEHKGILNHRHL